VKTCPDCNGDGVIEKGTDDEQQCPTCGGSGFVPDDDNDEEVTRTASEKLRSKLPGIRPAELRWVAACMTRRSMTAGIDKCRSQRVTVLIISMATVIGPAPPGTVTYEAFAATPAKSTSPTSRPSGQPVDIPTLITTAPVRTICGEIRFGCPAATTSESARSVS
jgi:hypothetical protein